MLAYKISPEYKLILIRLDGSETIDRVYDFVNSISNDANYNPSYQIIVNDTALANKACNNHDLAASVIGGFFAKYRAHNSAQVCYCHQ